MQKATVNMFDIEKTTEELRFFNYLSSRSASIDNRAMTEDEEMLCEVIRNYSVSDSDALVSDNKNDLVCFCDPKSKRITEVYTSDTKKKERYISQIKGGKKCFEILKNRNRPCPFCTDELLAKDRYYVWPYHDLLSDNTYIHKSRTIMHEGKSLRMETLQDVSDPKRKDLMLTQALKSMRLWAECTRLMSFNHPFDQAINYLLEEMGVYLNARSAFITFFGPNKICSLWPSRDDISIPAFLDNPTPEALSAWKQLCRNKAHIHIPNIAEADIPAPLKSRLLAYGHSSVLLYPLFIDDDLKGALCLNSVSMNTLQAGMVDLIAESIIETYRRHEAEVDSSIMKYHDKLTGALNFEGFKHVAKQALDDNPDIKYSFWYCDIRHFRYIIDLFGYDTGLEFIKYWVDIAVKDARAEDVVCRNAVDSLVALRAQNSAEEIEERFRKRMAQLAEFPAFKKRGYRPELVCGIYLITEEERLNPDFGLFLTKSSIAQKVARYEVGSNLTFYDEELKLQQIREMELKQSFSDALENREFFILLQPQYEYKSNRLMGAEALVRWKHSKLGLLPPCDFIPVLEQTGQITEVDLFVCEEACRLIREIQGEVGEYDGVPLSVNLSRLDVLQPGLPAKLLEIAKKYGVSPAMLHFEITESVLVDNTEELNAAIHELKSYGFGIEIDDFGSGYSALTTLKDVEADIIKLDMGFLADGYDDEHGGIILKSVIAMINSLGLTTLAEGVETKEQAEYLNSFECKVMQGYFFAKPLPISEFKELFISSMKK